jgi:drug/metabolite transporter (DMT)-like permease
VAPSLFRCDFSLYAGATAPKVSVAGASPKVPVVSAVALGLVVASAFIHALWNLFAKRATGGATFVWLCAATGAVLYAPVAALVVVIVQPELDRTDLLFLVGTACLHLAYFLFLQKGYSVGELSLIYPLARGTGPLLATAAAIVLFDESPGAPAFIGAVLIGGGVLALARTNRREGQLPAIVFGLATGVSIAAYTLWDKHAVDALALPPLLMTWSNDFGRALLLTPVVAKRRAAILATWQRDRAAILAVAVLSPLAYILVLIALTSTPVSYVAPAREISILIGAALGVTVLDEQNAPYRMAAAAAILAGVIGLAIG